MQCSPGYEDINGKCEKCKKGFYKAEYAAALCKECPTGFITSEEGTVDKGNCTVRKCSKRVVCNIFYKYCICIIIVQWPGMQ